MLLYIFTIPITFYFHLHIQRLSHRLRLAAILQHGFALDLFHVNALLVVK